jgi:transcriptional regulator with XRE-family HTH domain
LSRSLLTLRERARLKQTEAAEQAGLTQSKLSRAERGRGLLDDDMLRRLAELYRATPAERDALLELAAVARPGRVDSRLIMQRGVHHFQERVRKMEAQSALIRSFQPTMVFGVLQTAAYAEAVFSQPGRNRSVGEPSPAELARARTRRFQQLAESRRRQVLIQTAGALDWHVGSPEIMAEQMDQLAKASRLPNVRLGIIPARTRSRVFAQHGFHIYDQRVVSIGTKTAYTLTDHPDDLAEYQALFAELEALAVYDDDVRALLTRVSAEYRAMR